MNVDARHIETVMKEGPTRWDDADYKFHSKYHINETVTTGTCGVFDKRHMSKEVAGIFSCLALNYHVIVHIYLLYLMNYTYFRVFLRKMAGA